MVHACVAGVASTLPARVGRTHLEPVVARREALVGRGTRARRERARASSEHWNVAPLSEANENVAPVVDVEPVGPVVIVVSGGVVSTVVVMTRLLGFAAFTSSAVMKTRRSTMAW